MEPATSSKKRQLITVLAVLIVVVAIVAAVTATNKKNASMTDTSQLTATSSASSSSSRSNTSGSTSSSSTAGTTTFKDGTYTATGSYDSPGGTESIKVSVTLVNGVVTATSATSQANDPEAREYQSEFIASYKQAVVAKKISDVSLNRVSGSSLTSQGFNNAIQKIESQAKA